MDLIASLLEILLDRTQEFRVFPRTGWGVSNLPSQPLESSNDTAIPELGVKRILMALLAGISELPPDIGHNRDGEETTQKDEIERTHSNPLVIRSEILPTRLNTGVAESGRLHPWLTGQEI
jgi:hypothetical protein